MAQTSRAIFGVQELLRLTSGPAGTEALFRQQQPGGSPLLTADGSLTVAGTYTVDLDVQGLWRADVDLTPSAVSGTAFSPTLTALYTDGTTKVLVTGSPFVASQAQTLSLLDTKSCSKIRLSFTLPGASAITFSRAEAFLAPSNLVADRTSVGQLSTTSQAVTIPTEGHGTVLIDLSGTWTGTVTFEYADDVAQATFQSISASPVSGGASSSTSTANGIWRVACAGMTAVRARFSTASSGTVVATLRSSVANAVLSTALAATSGVSNTPVGPVTLLNSSNKANIGQTGSLASSATTVDQVIKTYTVTGGKTLYLQGFDVIARLTTWAATSTDFGDYSLETPSGTKLYTGHLAGPGKDSSLAIRFTEPIPIAAGVVVRLVATPAVTTAITWNGNLYGNEK